MVYCTQHDGEAAAPIGPASDGACGAVTHSHRVRGHRRRLAAPGLPGRRGRRRRLCRRRQPRSGLRTRVCGGGATRRAQLHLAGGEDEPRQCALDRAQRGQSGIPPRWRADERSRPPHHPRAAGLRIPGDQPGDGVPDGDGPVPGPDLVVAHKPVAVAGGLGVMGIHRNVIHPKFGNFILLGTVIVAAPISSYGRPLDYSPCLECKLCVAACPVGAIKKTGDFDFFACSTHNYREFMGVSPIGCRPSPTVPTLPSSVPGSAIRRTRRCGRACRTRRTTRRPTALRCARRGGGHRALPR